MQTVKQTPINRYALTIENIGTRSITTDGRLWVDGVELFGHHSGEKYFIHGYQFEWLERGKWQYQKGWQLLSSD